MEQVPSIIPLILFYIGVVYFRVIEFARDHNLDLNEEDLSFEQGPLFPGAEGTAE